VDLVGYVDEQPVLDDSRERREFRRERVRRVYLAELAVEDEVPVVSHDGAVFPLGGPQLWPPTEPFDRLRDRSPRVGEDLDRDRVVENLRLFRRIGDDEEPIRSAVDDLLAGVCGTAAFD